MLTHAGCLERRARLWDRLPADLKWALIADPRHVYYLSGFLVQPLSFSVGERGLLLLERNGPATLFADNFTRRSALAPPHVDAEQLTTWYDHKHSVINRDTALFTALEAVAPRLADSQGIVEADWLPLRAARMLPNATDVLPDQSGSPTTLGDLIRTLRRNKHADEVVLLEQAMIACAAGHEAALATVAPGVTEFQVYQAIHAAVLNQTRKPVQIYGDFRSTNAAVPKRGGAPTELVLADRDLLLLDYSVLLDGYRSDFTNTVCAGTPSIEQQQMFAACEQALLAGEAALRAGVSARDVYQATAGPLNATLWGKTFTHHAGHGLGMGHPEPPIIVADSTDTLEAGDVVTLEPGLYVEGIGGIRLEHNYLVTETGCRRLSPHRLALTR